MSKFGRPWLFSRFLCQIPGKQTSAAVLSDLQVFSPEDQTKRTPLFALDIATTPSSLPRKARSYPYQLAAFAFAVFMCLPMTRLESQSKEGMTMSETFFEEAREIKVFACVDVLVCGGGTSGIFAALASSRQGADTFLIDQEGFCGGTATSYLVNPIPVMMGKGGLIQEFMDRMADMGGYIKQDPSTVSTCRRCLPEVRSKRDFQRTTCR